MKRNERKKDKKERKTKKAKNGLKLTTPAVSRLTMYARQRWEGETT
jgi:hypothetical protein